MSQNWLTLFFYMKKGDYTFIVIYIVLASIGTLFSTHLFDEHRLMTDFYIYYTNLSNYFCLIVMVLVLKYNLKANTYTKLPNYLNGLMFVAGQVIFITFCVYNFLLADFSVTNYWTNPYNLLFHVVLPIMFVGYAISRCYLPKIWWLVVPTAVQFGYVLVIYLRSLLISNASGRLIYPYFFLNFATLGVKTSIKWLIYMFIISACATMFISVLIVINNKLIKKMILNKKTNNNEIIENYSKD